MRVSSFKFRLVVLGGILLATVLLSGCATIDLYPGNVIDEGTVGRTEEPQTYLELQLGQVAQSDSLAVRVSKVDLVMDYSYPDPAGPGTLSEVAPWESIFALVEVEFANTGTSRRIVGQFDFALTDTSGSLYSATPYSGIDRLELTDLLPDETVGGVVLFEIPDYVTPDVVAYGFSEGFLSRDSTAAWEISPAN